MGERTQVPVPLNSNDQFFNTRKGYRGLRTVERDIVPESLPRFMLVVSIV